MKISHQISFSILYLLIIFFSCPIYAQDAHKLTRHNTPDNKNICTNYDQRRIIAIGDVHGDLDTTLTALRLAGAINKHNNWVGGDLIVVQTGDVLDRGDDDIAILNFFEKLKVEASKTGGEFIMLNGNHELLNIEGVMKYVTPGGIKASENIKNLDLNRPELNNVPNDIKSRVAAFMPGGPYANMLAKNKVILHLGDTVFVHGGLLPTAIAYGTDRINTETQAWMRGEIVEPPIMRSPDSPVWVRTFSFGIGDSDHSLWHRILSLFTGKTDCALLTKVLKSLNAKRMVVGHTVQKNGITSACNGKIWRIDVGMAYFYGGNIEILEIVGSNITILREK